MYYKNYAESTCGPWTTYIKQTKVKKIHSRDQKYLNILKIVSHVYKHNKILNLFYFGHWLKIERSSE